MQARNHRAQRDGVQVERGLGQIDPCVEADVGAIRQLRDDGTFRRAADRGRRHASCGGGLLERRALEDPRELLGGDLLDDLDRPAAVGGVEPPDRTQPAPRDGIVGQTRLGPQTKGCEQAGDVSRAQTAQRPSSGSAVASSRPAVADEPARSAARATDGGSSWSHSVAKVQARYRSKVQPASWVNAR